MLEVEHCLESSCHAVHTKHGGLRVQFHAFSVLSGAEQSNIGCQGSRLF